MVSRHLNGLELFGAQNFASLLALVQQTHLIVVFPSHSNEFLIKLALTVLHLWLLLLTSTIFPHIFVLL